MLAPHQLTLVLRHLSPARAIDAVAALLLPFDEDGRPDLDALASLVRETYAAGLIPAVNTTAGYVELLSDDERTDVLTIAAGVARGRRFIAGAWLDDHAADAGGRSSGDLGARYAQAMDRVARQGGTPLLLPCAALTALDDDRLAEAHRAATAAHPGALAAEIGPAFASFGRIYSLDLFQRLLDIPTMGGLLHASQSRVPEWYRLEARDARRPEFRLYTGNDLAIDMPAYGSDYLLAGAGLAPEGFAVRDRLWASSDARVTELNDALQYLCGLVRRRPVDAWRHGLAQVLHLRGAIPSASPHPRSARRPDGDRELLADAFGRVCELLQATSIEPPFPLSAARR
jgi:dihydrodipicolinate synthase/N-acetylneuraminate lyase